MKTLAEIGADTTPEEFKTVTLPDGNTFEVPKSMSDVDIGKIIDRDFTRSQPKSEGTFSDIFAPFRLKDIAASARMLGGSAQQMFGESAMFIDQQSKAGKLPFVPSQLEGWGFPDVDEYYRDRAEYNPTREEMIPIAQEGYDRALEAAKELQEIAPDFSGHPGLWFAEKVLRVTRDMIPAMALGRVSPDLGARAGITTAAMSLQAGLGAYHQRRQAGESVGEALAGSGATALIEGATEYIPMKWLMESGSTFMKRALDMTVGEGLQEAVSSALSSAYDKGTIDPDMTLGDAIKNMMIEGALGAASGPILAGIAQPFAPTKGEIAGRMLNDLVEQTELGQSFEPPMEIVNPTEFADPAVQAGYQDEILKMQQEDMFSAPQSTFKNMDVPLIKTFVNNDGYINDALSTLEQLGPVTQTLSKLHSADPLMLEVAKANLPDVQRQLVDKLLDQDVIQSAIDDAIDNTGIQYDGDTGYFTIDGTQVLHTEYGQTDFDENNIKTDVVAEFNDPIQPHLFMQLLNEAGVTPSVSHETFQPWQTVRDSYLNSLPEAERPVEAERHRRAVKERVMNYDYESALSERVKENQKAQDQVVALESEAAAANDENTYQEIKAEIARVQQDDSMAQIKFNLSKKYGVPEDVLEDYPDIKAEFEDMKLKAAKTPEEIRDLVKRYPDAAARFLPSAAEVGLNNAVNLTAVIDLNAEYIDNYDFSEKNGKKNAKLFKWWLNTQSNNSTKKARSSTIYNSEGESFRLKKPRGKQATMMANLIGSVLQSGLPRNALDLVKGVSVLETSSDGTHAIHITGTGTAHQSQIGMNEDMIRVLHRGTRAEKLTGVNMMLHEIGHAIDRKLSLESPLFELQAVPWKGSQAVRLGPVINEMMRAYTEDTLGLGKWLAYPMSGVSFLQNKAAEGKFNQGYANLIKQEAFAQLHALFYTFHNDASNMELLNKHFPKATAFMEKVHESHYQPTERRRRDALSNAFRRSAPPTSVQKLFGSGYQFFSPRSSGQGPTYTGLANRVDRTLAGRGERDTEINEVVFDPSIVKTRNDEILKMETRSVDTVPILSGDEVMHVDSESKAPSVLEIAHALNNRALEVFHIPVEDYAAKSGTGEPVDPAKYIQARDYVADVMKRELLYQLSRDDHAGEWYAETIDKAFEVIRLVHPELKDIKMESLFKLVMAITSQGMKVHRNLILAENAYQTWFDTGVFPMVGEGPQAKYINSGLRKLQMIVDDMRVEGAYALAHDTGTRGEIEKRWDAEIGDELVTEQLTGASIFGPKVGAFFSNLDGNWDPVTMDLWWARMFNRITGNMIHKDARPETQRNRYIRLQKAIDAGEAYSVPMENGEMYDLKEVRNNDALLDEISEAVFRKVQREYNKRIRNKDVEKTEWELATQNLYEANRGKAEDAPRHGSERHFMRDAIKTAIADLNTQGYNITPASAQALLWYQEKLLYDILKGRKNPGDKMEPEDYFDSAKKIYAKRLRAGGVDGRKAVPEPGEMDPTEILAYRPEEGLASLEGQTHEAMMNDTIKAAADALPDDGRIRFEYPQDTDLPPSVVRQNIKDHFASVSRVGGSMEAPIWEASTPIRPGYGTLHSNPVIVVRDTYQQVAGQVVKKARETIFSPFLALGSLPNQQVYLEERYRYIGGIMSIDHAAKRIHETFSGVPKDVQDQIYTYLTTQGADPAMIEDLAVTVKEHAGGRKQVSVRQRAVAMKRMFNAIGNRLVDAGMVSEESREKYRDAYLPRIYLKHLLAGGARVGSTAKLDQRYLNKRDDSIPKEWRRLMGEVTDPGFLAARGMAIPLKDLQTIDFLNNLSRHREWVLPDYQVPVAFNTGSGIVRAELAKSSREGRSVSVFWLKSESERVREQALHMEPDAKADAIKYADDLLELSRLAPQDSQIDHKLFKQVPDTAQYGPMRGMYVRKEIWNDLFYHGGWAQESDSNLTQKILGDGGYIQQGTRIWKILKVPLNPPTVIRNIVSNFIMAYVYGGVADIRNYAKAVDEIRNNGEHYRTLMRYGVQGGTFTTQELNEVSDMFLDLAAREDIDWSQGMAWAKLANILSKATKPFTGFYQNSELFFKLAVMIDAMENKGMDEVDAVLHANEAIFDYSLLTPGAKALRSNIIGIPFLTFYYKSLGKTLETAVTAPWRFAPVYGLMWGMLEWLKSAWDIDDDDLEALKLTMNKWLREKGHAFFIPYRDEHGRMQALDIGYFLPWTAHYQTARNLKNGEVMDVLQEMGFLGTPLASLIVATQNKDAFTGYEIANEFDPPGTQAYDIMNYIWRLSMPTWMTDIGFAGHMYRAMTDKLDTRRIYHGEPTSTTTQAALRMFGINLYPVDPERSRDSQMRQFKSQIMGYKSRMRRKLKDPNIGFDAAGQKRRQQIVADHMEMIDKVKEEMIEYEKKSRIPDKLLRAQ